MDSRSIRAVGASALQPDHNASRRDTGGRGRLPPQKEPARREITLARSGGASSAGGAASPVRRNPRPVYASGVRPGYPVSFPNWAKGEPREGDRRSDPNLSVWLALRFQL